MARDLSGLLSVVTALLLSVMPLCALLVDDFSDGSFSLSVDSAKLSDEITQSGLPNTLGGGRDVSLSLNSATGSGDMELGLDAYSIPVLRVSAAANSTIYFELSYNADGPGVDLTGGGPDRFSVEVAEVSGSVSLSVRVTDDFGASGLTTFSTISSPGPATWSFSAFTNIYDPLTEVDFTRVRSITFLGTISASVSNQAMTFRDFATQPANDPPVADAGPDQNIAPDVPTTLEAGASDTDGQPSFSWRWTVQAAPPGSSPLIQTPYQSDPVFVASVPGDYILSLIARDTWDWSAPDTVTLRVGETAALRVSEVQLDGTLLTIGFTGDPGVTGWTVMGSGDLQAFDEDKTADSTISETSPGTYEAVVELGSLTSRYFIRIER